MEIHLLMQSFDVFNGYAQGTIGTSKSKKAILVILVMVEAHNHKYRFRFSREILKYPSCPPFDHSFFTVSLALTWRLQILHDGKNVFQAVWDFTGISSDRQWMLFLVSNEINPRWVGGKGKSCCNVVFLAIVNVVDSAQQIGWVGWGKAVAHWLVAGCHTHL